jgi:hypothetical protein
MRGKEREFQLMNEEKPAEKAGKILSLVNSNK